MIATDTTTKTALYYRPGNRGRWKLFGTYATRDEAFRAMDLQPDRHPTFMLQDVPAPNVTPADLARFRTRFAAGMKTVAPALAEVEATAKKVMADELAKVGAEVDKVNALANDVFRAEVAKLAELQEADAATE